LAKSSCKASWAITYCRISLIFAGRRCAAIALQVISSHRLPRCLMSDRAKKPERPCQYFELDGDLLSAPKLLAGALLLVARRGMCDVGRSRRGRQSATSAEQQRGRQLKLGSSAPMW
jgi:hypothetical protein